MHTYVRMYAHTYVRTYIILQCFACFCLRFACALPALPVRKRCRLANAVPSGPIRSNQVPPAGPDWTGWDLKGPLPQGRTALPRGGGQQRLRVHAQVVNLVENDNEIGNQNLATGGIGAAAPPGTAEALLAVGAETVSAPTWNCFSLELKQFQLQAETVSAWS